MLSSRGNFAPVGLTIRRGPERLDQILELLQGADAATRLVVDPTHCRGFGPAHPAWDLRMSAVREPDGEPLPPLAVTGMCGQFNVLSCQGVKGVVDSNGGRNVSIVSWVRPR